MGRLVDNEGDDTLEMVSESGNLGRKSFLIFSEWFKLHLPGNRLQNGDLEDEGLTCMEGSQA